MLGDCGIEKYDEGEINYVLLHVGDAMDTDEFKVHKAPYDLVEPPPNTEKGGPIFEKVYNPGRWSSFS